MVFVFLCLIYLIYHNSCLNIFKTTRLVSKVVVPFYIPTVYPYSV